MAETLGTLATEPLANVAGSPLPRNAVQKTLATLATEPLANVAGSPLPRNAVQKTLTALPGPARPGTVVVIGEALVEIHPDGTEEPGGSSASVAVALGRLSRFPRLVTTIGDDARGDVLRRWLRSSYVETIAAPTQTGRSLTTAVALDESSAADDVEIDWALPPELAIAAIDGAEALHVGSIAAVWRPGADAVELAMLAARDAGVLVSYGPNARPHTSQDLAASRARVEQLVALADVVKVSAENLAWYYPGEDPEIIARRWAELGPAMVVVTLGGEGALGVHVGDEVTVSRVPAVAVDVVDTVGAGDTFMGALIDALTRGFDLPDAMAYAARAAAINCTRPGVDPPTRADLGG